MATRNPYRGLPSVDRMLADERMRALSAQYCDDTVGVLVREALDGARMAGGRGGDASDKEKGPEQWRLRGTYVTVTPRPTILAR